MMLTLRTYHLGAWTRLFLSENACFFQLFFSNKSKNCRWNDTKFLFMCYSTCQAQKRKIQFIVISTWFLILGKIQDGNDNGDQDGDHCGWRHKPPSAPPPTKYTTLMRRSKAFHWRKNRLKHCKILKTLGSVNPPSPVPEWGMNLRVRLRFKWRLGYWNLGYITIYKFIPLKASCWKSIAFFAGCVASFHS